MRVFNGWVAFSSCAAILLGFIPAKAEPSFPLSIVLASGAVSSCQLQENKFDGKGRQIASETIPISVTTTLSSVRYKLKIKSRNTITVIYSKKLDGSFNNRPTIISGGPDFETLSHTERSTLQTYFRNILSISPFYESLLPKYNIIPGDPYHTLDKENFLDAWIHQIRPDAVQKSFKDTTFVREIRKIDGRPSLIISGSLTASYATQGIWVDMSNTSSFSIDIETGLSRSGSATIKVSSDGNLYLRSEQKMHCSIDASKINNTVNIKNDHKNENTDNSPEKHSNDVRKRLERVGDLLKDGLITKEEADSKRKEILQDL